MNNPAGVIFKGFFEQAGWSCTFLQHALPQLVNFLEFSKNPLSLYSVS